MKKKRHLLVCLWMMLAVGLMAGYQPTPLTFKGKPFFMLGNYDARMGKSPRKSMNPLLKGSGANTVVLPVDLKNQAQYEKDISIISWFAQHQPTVAVIIDLDMGYLFQRDKTKKTAALSAEEQQKRLPHLVEMLQTLRRIGNVIGYTLDEPENALYSTLEQWRAKHPSTEVMDIALSHYIVESMQWVQKAIRENHPEAVYMPIQGWWTTYEADPELYDVLIADEYPVTGDQQAKPTLYGVAYDAQLAADAVKKLNKRCFIYMPPGFNILDAGKWKNMRPYTKEELRYLWFTPLSYGAQGILGWRQYRCTNEFARERVFPVMNEINSIVPWLLGENLDEHVKMETARPVTEYKVPIRSKMAGKEDEEYQIRPVKTISWIARRNPADKSLMLIACNNSCAEAAGAFILDSTLKDSYQKGQEIFENHGVGFSGRLKFSVPALSVRIFLLYDKNEMTR